MNDSPRPTRAVPRQARRGRQLRIRQMILCSWACASSLVPDLMVGSLARAAEPPRQSMVTLLGTFLLKPDSAHQRRSEFLLVAISMINRTRPIAAMPTPAPAMAPFQLSVSPLPVAAAATTVHTLRQNPLLSEEISPPSPLRLWGMCERISFSA